MTYDPSNIFAKILRNEVPCLKISEDANHLAFLDVMPISDGHTLVIPKTEAKNITDISPEALTQLILTVQTLAQQIQTRMNSDGILIQQRNGAAAGQEVFHLHFHIIPCYAGQEFRERKFHSAEELAPIHAQLVKTV